MLWTASFAMLILFVRGVTDFNLPAFEQAVAERSPLLPSQVSDLFGAVSVENKSLVWDFIRLPAKLQMMSWQARKHFPGATVRRIR